MNSLDSVMHIIDDSFIESGDNHKRKVYPKGFKHRLIKTGDDHKKIYIKNKIKLVGFLFCHPESAIGKSVIVPMLEHYHIRSGEFSDYFCGGYGIASDTEEYTDRKCITVIDGDEWFFSAKMFNDFINELEEKTAWKYSGDTELVLATARFDTVLNKPYIDFTDALVCVLETLLKDAAIDSVPSFFESIFRFSKENESGSTYEFSDLKLLEVGRQSLLDWVLDCLKMKGLYKQTVSYAVRDISRT